MAYERSLNQVIEILQQEDLATSRQSSNYITTTMKQAADKADDLLSKVVEFKMANASHLNDETERIYGDIRVLLISLTLGGLVVGIAIGYFLTRGLTRQLGGEPVDVARIADGIARGDLTVDIDTSRATEGSVVAAMRTMQTALIRLVGEVSQASDSIATGATQIATGNSDLSQRTEEQASNLEETAASMEELASTVKLNTEAAQQATQLASSATSAAEQGGEVVHQVVSTMKEISASSNRIQDIIGCDRQHSVPDKYSCTQRSGGSSKGWRRGAWFCRRGRGSPYAGSAQRRSSQRDQRPHRHKREKGARRQRTGRESR